MNLQQNANYQLMSYIMRWQKKKRKKRIPRVYLLEIIQYKDKFGNF